MTKKRSKRKGLKDREGPLVAVDTQVLVWGFRDAKAPVKDEVERQMRIRARILLDMLDERRARILISSVVIGELIVPIAQDKREGFISVLQQHFHCTAYDLKAAAIAAILWDKHQTFAKDDAYRDRPLLKADAQIVACAIASGATEFYSHDRKCRKLVEGFPMVARDLPKKHDNFITDKEIRTELGEVDPDM